MGRPAAVHGRPGRVRGRVDAGRGRPDPRPADRRAADPGRWWGRAGPGRDRGGLAPVRRCGAAPRARRRRGADIPGDGGRAGGGCRDPRVGPPGERDGRGGPRRNDRGGGPGAGLAVGLLPEHPDLDHRRDPRLGGGSRLGDAASRRPGRPPGGGPVRDRAGRRASRADPARFDGDRRKHDPARRRDGRPARGRGGRVGDRRGPRPARPRAVPRPAALPERAVQLGRAGVVADRLRIRDRHHRRRGVRGPGALRRPRRAAPGTGRTGRRDGPRGPRVRLPGAGGARSPGRARRDRVEHRRAARDVVVDERRRDRHRGSRPGRVWPRLRADRDAAVHGGGRGGRPARSTGPRRRWSPSRGCSGWRWASRS